MNKNYRKKMKSSLDAKFVIGIATTGQRLRIHMIKDNGNLKHHEFMEAIAHMARVNLVRTLSFNGRRRRNRLRN